ncbi:PRC and DUF2382 domain-containing protein [Tsukamurella serpentis]
MANNNLSSLANSTVYDRDGEKVGKVEQVYIDGETQYPTWVAAKTGWFGSASLVPLSGARHSEDRIDVVATKDQIKDAPHLDTDEGISEAQQNELFQHYGLTRETAGWDTYGKHADDGSTANSGSTATGSTATGSAAGVGAATGAAAGATDDRRSATPTDTDSSVVRSEERLNVGTERVATGRARLRKYVVTEEKTVTVPVTREHVEVVREPITGAEAGDVEIGDGTAEVTLHEDRVVTDKETVPVERVGLQVNTEQGKQTVSDTVRKERVEQETVDPSRR